MKILIVGFNMTCMKICHVQEVVTIGDTERCAFVNGVVNAVVRAVIDSDSFCLGSGSGEAYVGNIVNRAVGLVYWGGSYGRQRTALHFGGTRFYGGSLGMFDASFACDIGAPNGTLSQVKYL